MIALEQRALWGGLIDLDHTKDALVSAQLLLAELCQRQPDSETQVAYRKGTRHVARLVQGKLKRGKALT